MTANEQLVDDIQELLENLPLPGPFKIFSRFFNERRLAEGIARLSIRYVEAKLKEQPPDFTLRGQI